MTPRVVVVGAGITGLAAALELRKLGRDVVVLESSDRAGGLIRTTATDGYVFEHGPIGYPESAAHVRELVEEVGLQGRVQRSREAAARRLIYTNGHLHPVPTSPQELWRSEIFRLRDKLRIAMEPFVPVRRKSHPESIAAFVSRRFGTAAARTVADAFVSGIYAGDARRVGVQSAFPRLVAMVQEHGSILKAMRRQARASGGEFPKGLMSFPRGMQELTDAMAARLGPALRLGTRVATVTREDRAYRIGVESADGVDEIAANELVLATPARAAGFLLAGLNAMISDLLFDIVYAGLLTVHASFAEKQLGALPEAFGFLVPRPQRIRTLGWLLNSKIFADRAPDGVHAMTGYIGGATDPQALSAPREAIRRLMLGELSLMLRRTSTPKPLWLEIDRAEPGLPQYDLGHAQRMKAVGMLAAEMPGLRLVGNWVGGIGLDDCVRSARAAARDLVGGGGAG